MLKILVILYVRSIHWIGGLLTELLSGIFAVLYANKSFPHTKSIVRKKVRGSIFFCVGETFVGIYVCEITATQNNLRLW